MAWEELESVQQGRIGQPSQETAFALKHTAITLVKLCDYLLKDHDLHCVLLGKFQTDKLEHKNTRSKETARGQLTYTRQLLYTYISPSTIVVHEFI